MRKEKSWTRVQYENNYRWVRRGIDVVSVDINASDPYHIIKAADYSYQGANYDVHGWSSEMRRQRFYRIVWRILTQREVFPF